MEIARRREARLSVREAAITRWQRHESERARNIQLVAMGGAGAADSPQRNVRLRARESTYERARALHRRGLLPSYLERRIGPTLDYSPYAPSEQARAVGRPVARIVELAGPGLQPEGIATGFLIAPSLLLTNHHVFPTRSDAVGTGANFLYERTDRGLQTGVIFEIDPAAFYVSDARLDFAVIAVKPQSLDGAHTLGEFGAIALIEATPKILIGQQVRIIQYPAGGSKQYAIRQNRLVNVLEDGFLHYETDTLEGSSGSPAFSESWELVALHHAGIPEIRDGRVVSTDGGLWEPGMPDEKVHWIANEGIRVSAMVKHLAGLRLENPVQQTMLRELLANTTDPVDDLATHILGGDAFRGAPETGQPVQLSADSIGGASMGNNHFHFTGPVTIHVYAPTANAPETTMRIDVPIPTPIAIEASIRFDPFYVERKGYDPYFLGAGIENLKVPSPTVIEARKAEIYSNPAGEPIVLKYHHFELVMNEKRRLQMWSAVNVDYDPIKTSARSREEFGRDRWVLDPRIPARIQISDAEFYKPAGNIDRGHIVRREDNAWGETEQEMEFANADTFHWTNCTPQHEAFNQSAPGRNDAAYRGLGGVWGAFENHIQQSLKGADSKASILAGPVLETTDPDAVFGGDPIQYPLRFWKVVAAAALEPGAVGASERTLRVFGFTFSQKPVVDRFGIEAFGPGKFEQYQASLRNITEISGVEFDPQLHAADVLKTTVAGQETIKITRPDEIQGLPVG